MATPERFHWGRVALASVAAETIPIVLLVVVVTVYAMIQSPEWQSAEEFAPRAGNWVGPIGGFFVTLLVAYRVARRVTTQPFAHGVAVGIGTAILDVTLGMLLGSASALSIVFGLSNVGRVIAGILGGWLGERTRIKTG